MTMLQRFFRINIRMSQAFDRLLPFDYKIDGNSDFSKSFAPRWILPRMRVVDVGGGKNPFLSVDRKSALSIHVTGVDISEHELLRAPPGAYDIVRCGDIAQLVGSGDADVCICQAVLEHVRDVEAAFGAIASFLKPGGVALIFVPSRNAVFARLNLLLPESVKRFLLYTAFPSSRRDQGFPSFYNKCTPSQFEAIAEGVGLTVLEARHYYMSSYFSIFAPFYAVWRVWVVLFRCFGGIQAAETFAYAFRKKD